MAVFVSRNESSDRLLVERLGFPRRQQFARCALVRVGQWALDARESIPLTATLSDKLENLVESMLGGLSELVSTAKAEGVYKNKITATRQLLSYSAFDPLLGVCPRNNVLNDMRHWWSVKMLITPLQSPECCKQVIVWRFSSPGTNTRTGS